MAAERGEEGFHRKVEFFKKRQSRFLVLRHVLLNTHDDARQGTRFHHVALPARALDPGVLARFAQPRKLRCGTVAARGKFKSVVRDAVPGMQAFLTVGVLVPGVINEFLHLFGIAQIHVVDFVKLPVDDGAAGQKHRLFAPVIGHFREVAVAEDVLVAQSRAVLEPFGVEACNRL